MRVLSLCDKTGNMVRPWVEAGHEAVIVDLQHPAGVTREGMLMKVGADIVDYYPDGHFDAVFAFPPCTDLAASGARWWKEKGPQALADALALVDACRRIIAATGTSCWMLENPIGRLATHWRKADHIFHPYEYGGYLDPAGDRYTKATCLWVGPGFRMPIKRPVDPTEGSKMHRLPPSPDRKNVRSATPMAFARAVFEAHATPSPPVR
jgi:hypothetical protein